MATDLRILKTNRDLRAAMVTLLGKQHYSTIRIKDLCAAALVQRTTFYQHYHNRTELFYDVLDHLVVPWQNCDLVQVLHKPFTPFPATDVQTFCAIYKKQYRDPLFSSELGEYFQNYYYHIFAQHPLKVPVSHRLLAKIYNDEVTDIYTEWLVKHSSGELPAERLNWIFSQTSRVPACFTE